MNEVFKPALTAIICSINPDNLKRTEDNLRQTAGVSIEVLGFDNREKKWGIGKVYNYMASRAKAEYLLFVHEDVLFESNNWGTEIINKLSDTSVGVVGFAGSTFKCRAYSGWLMESAKNSMRCNISNPDSNFSLHIRGTEMSDDNYARVVTVDGLALFMSKTAWKNIHFDEKIITGFHCYDLDISLKMISSGRKNYIWYGPEVLHLSLGSYDENWMKSTIIAHDMSWHNILPISIDKSVSSRQYKQSEACEDYFFMTRCMSSMLPKTFKRKLLYNYIRKMTYKPYYVLRFCKGIKEGIIKKMGL